MTEWHKSLSNSVWAAFSTTALLGGVLVFILVWCYPKVMTKLSGIFGPTMIFYVILFFGETFTLLPLFLWLG